jgi:hypothetical protein
MPLRETIPAGTVMRLSWFGAPGWLLAILLLIGTAGFGVISGGLARPLFLAGCLVVGWLSWKQSPQAHLQAAMVLFSFAPFVRRVVDLHAGYDPSSIMLVGPLLTLAVVAPPLLLDLEKGSLRSDRRLLAHAIVLGCVGYAALLCIFQGKWSDAIVGAIKWCIPLLYGAALIRWAEKTSLIQAATSAFVFILPVTGLYGALQYVDPPAWDQLWMNYASIMSAGLPFPYEVRTFSTMNGPASYATFTGAGILLVCFLRSPLVIALACSAPALSFMLSQYRTAWMALLVALLFCLFARSTKGRAALVFACMFGAGLLALSLPPFSDVILERFETLGSGSQDGSLQERLDQFVTLWTSPNSSVVGTGFTTVDVGVAGSMAIDGLIIECWLMMGLIVGGICLATITTTHIGIIWKALGQARREMTVAGALGLYALFQIPFASLASGELGFLFWTIAAFSSSEPSRSGGDA